MRILTAGESHGEAMIAILEGFPKGVKVEESFINKELQRRQKGFGRGGRMGIEKDEVHIISGLRNKVSLGSPIAVMVRNKDQKIFTQKKDNLSSQFIPRPAHADLPGCLKYQEKDIRNILERASARETTARVCVGSICKQFLFSFNIRIASFVVGVGGVVSRKKPRNVEEIIRRTRSSCLNCIDRKSEKLMIHQIKMAEEEGDTLGGVVEVWAENVPPGLGSFMHFDKRLDAKIAGLMMGIPAARGVEIGLGFEYSKKRGSLSHDIICFSKAKGWYRKTNNAGGIEGGLSNGEPIVVRVGMKPISTLGKPLDSVNLLSKKKDKAPVIRADICAVSAFGVIAESMLAIALTESLLEKFGCDSLGEIKRNYRSYLKSLPR
jgi:chorismate synthase